MIFAQLCNTRYSRRYLFLATVFLCFCVKNVNADIPIIRGASPIIHEAQLEIRMRTTEFFQYFSSLYPEGSITVEYSPTKRSVREVASGTIDFFYPVLCTQSEREGSGTRVGQQSFGTVPMGIYSRASNPVYRDDLLSAEYALTSDAVAALKGVFKPKELEKLRDVDETFTSESSLFKRVETLFGRSISDDEKVSLARAAFPYAVDTLGIHVPYVGLPASPDLSVGNSLKKLVRGRIDAYIFPPHGVEQIIEADHPNEKFARDLHEIVDLCFLVQDSERGEQLDKLLSGLFRRAQQDPNVANILGPIDDLYSQWVAKYRRQP